MLPGAGGNLRSKRITLQRECPELEITPLHPVNSLSSTHLLELDKKEEKCEAVRHAVRMLSIPQVEVSPVEQKRTKADTRDFVTVEYRVLRAMAFILGSAEGDIRGFYSSGVGHGTCASLGLYVEVEKQVT